MNKYIGKIIIVTNMRKIPRSCAECGYYDGMETAPAGATTTAFARRARRFTVHAAFG